jgi:hypothetical protein
VNWKITTNQLRSERGIGDLLAIIIGLPIILMLVAFLYNLLQGPYIQRGMRGALAEITSRAAIEAAKDTELHGVRPIDLSEPAGNLINPVGGVVVASTASAGPGILNAAMAESLVAEACKLSAGYLKSFVKSDSAFEFGIVKLSPGDLPASNTSLNVNVEASLVCPQNSLPASALDLSAFSVAKAATQLQERFHEISGNGSGLWALDQFSKTSNGDRQVKYLPSYWMIGVVSGKTTALAATFFGGTKYISEYHVHPFSAPAGIERVATVAPVNG